MEHLRVFVSYPRTRTRLTLTLAVSGSPETDSHQVFFLDNCIADENQE